MRFLIQRVTRAKVTVAGKITGEIQTGLLILAGVSVDDTADQARFLTAKTANLRIFEDAAGQMNRSALDLLAERPDSIGFLVVSQFTLYADARKGRRPSFVKAARPETASPLVDLVVEEFRKLGIPVQTGVFGEEMAVELVNDGPVTIWLDTDELQS
jgi:D-tyrosyl-tRNA(Tyr) deacylase